MQGKDRTCSVSKQQTPLENKELFKTEEYTVGIICAVPFELAALESLLDEKHERPNVPEGDYNTYTLGSVSSHKVVIACLPFNAPHTTATASAAHQMKQSFPKIRCALVVGVGGGIPDLNKRGGNRDIRLGDVVVGQPSMEYDGVVQLESEKDSFHVIAHSDGPTMNESTLLQTSISSLQATHILKGSMIPQIIAASLQNYPRMESIFSRPDHSQDLLFAANYQHSSTDPHSCCDCDKSWLVSRPSRVSMDPVIHYGTIVSANKAVKNASLRDQIRDNFDAVCLEAESAGLLNSAMGLVIRGVCDYADSHSNSNKQWQPYAALVAAAYVKELLQCVPPISVHHEDKINSAKGTDDSSLTQLPRATAVHRNALDVASIQHRRRDDKEEKDQSLACPFHKANPSAYSRGSKYGLKFKTCPRGFDNIRRLKDHLRLVHRGLPFYCPDCMSDFKTVDGLTQHQHRFRCKECRNSSDCDYDDELRMRRKLDMAMRKKPPGESRHHHWYWIWSILFPESEPPDHPFQNHSADEVFSRELMSVAMRQNTDQWPDDGRSAIHANFRVLEDGLGTCLGDNTSHDPAAVSPTISLPVSGNRPVTASPDYPMLYSRAPFTAKNSKDTNSLRKSRAMSETALSDLRSDRATNAYNTSLRSGKPLHDAGGLHDADRGSLPPASCYDVPLAQKPIHQFPNSDDDLYTPTYKRRNAKGEWEGWCGLCDPGQWHNLKNSRYWDDKLRNHGICARTKKRFQAPTQVRIVDLEGHLIASTDNICAFENILSEDASLKRVDVSSQRREALCGQCETWVNMDGLQSRNRAKPVGWWNHAYKCHRN